MQLLELKIKRMTLAAEARIIKAQEQKTLGKARVRAGVWSRADSRKIRESLIADGITDRQAQDDTISSIRKMANMEVEKLPADRLYATYHSLRNHRITVVRYVARAAHLANAYIKGVPYAKVEQSKYDYPAHRSYLVLSVHKDVRRFGGKRGENTTLKDISRWMDHGPTDWQKAADAEADAQTTAALEKAMAETGK